MKILIAEDDAASRKGVTVFLTNQGHTVVSVENGAVAWEKCLSERPDVILSDVKMPRMTGLQLLEKMRRDEIETPVIIMTAFASIQDAVEAMKMGAEDYVTKPLNLQELVVKLDRIQQKLLLLQENRSLRRQLEQLECPDIIGAGKPMQDVFRTIHRVAAGQDIPVMIYGESGTGKELVARTIHKRSIRAKGPFVAVNCAAIPDDLLESELFGYKRGAFTGAYTDKTGLFQAADGGTIFLDEVSEMSVRMQAKLLRVLQERKVQALGHTAEREINVRVMGASNKDLRAMMKDGQFRDDLFYRLNVMEINLPPLRERKSDIPLLLHHFTTIHSSGKKPEMAFSRQALQRLQDYAWPGNVRELENLVRVLLLTCAQKMVDLSDLPSNFTHSSAGTSPSVSIDLDTNYKNALNLVIEDFEKRYIIANLAKSGGNISRTAEKIGLSRVALHNKINKYGIVLHKIK